MSRYEPYLNFYIVWHPDFLGDSRKALGIAERLYREFCRDPEKPMSPAVGIPVYFRTSPKEKVAPLPIALDQAQHNVIALLGDSSMVLDDVFQDYVHALAVSIDDKRNRVLSFVWPDSGRLRLGNIQQITVKANEADAEMEIRMKLAAETCRLLQSRVRTGSNGLSPDPPMLFISHAKRDAEDKAEELKQLVENTPIDTFFDRVDIAAGFDFTKEIRENIKRSAILAWQSDEYGSRPWCNIELLAAKESLRPIVVVLGIKAGEERSFPYLGNVRTIVGTGTNSSEIIIAAVREYLRKLYAEGRFDSLSAAGMIPKTRFHLFRPPEPIDGALFEQRTNPGDQQTTTTPEPVMYPDPPISTVESEILSRLFPDIKFQTPTTIDSKSLTGMTVALSISEPEDVIHFGYSRLHLLSLMLEIARHVLSRGGTIAYGGDLRASSKGGFTRQLFQLVYAYKDLSRPPVDRIWNFLAHHIAAEIPKGEEAALLELAKFERPLSESLSRRFDLQPRKPVPDDSAENRYIRARCLSNMREAMLQKTDARVVIGGRVSQHQGKYPGILEETILTIGAKPLFVVGAFGGCAQLIARALRNQESPSAFSREYQQSHPRTATWRDSEGNQREEAVYFDQLADSYERYENDPAIGEQRIDYLKVLQKLHAAGMSQFNNGLSSEENVKLLETPDLDRIVSLIMKGLGTVRHSGTPGAQKLR